jgi:hypothetical protein
MDVMVKVNRAFKAAKASVTEIDNGQKQIAQKVAIFAHEGKRQPLTLQVIRESNGAAKLEMIIWDTRRMIQGKTVPLEEVKNIIPGFNENNIFFNSEIAALLKKSARKRKTDDYGRDIGHIQMAAMTQAAG